jgi:hypothetical protein
MRENESWRLALIPAIFGFIGVVGATITTGANYWMEVKREEAEKAKEQFTHEKELKIAARLVWKDFVYTRVDATKKTHIHLSLDAWQREKEILARELQFDEWRAVVIAGITAESLNHTPDEGAIGEDEAIVKSLDAGIKALEPYI